MNLSILNNSNFLNIIEDFAKNYELNVKFENSLYKLKLIVKNKEYINEGVDLIEVITLIISQYLTTKAEEKQITIDELIKDFSNVENMLKEIREG